jgi:uncharacterized repeat protein (TIGR01451 family)
VNGDDVLNLAASIAPNIGDYTPDDNTFEFAQVVVNSFDPNDKQVLQGEEITLEQKEEYLDYIIRFQNTGTASAIKVRVKDVLDAKLDWTTLKPVSASHSYKLEIKEDGQLEFIFNNINLPAQADDEEGSNGYIAYKIKPLQNIQVGNIITGSAEIYFDYNTPVITNTVSTEIVAPTAGLKTNIAANVAIYPNPVNDLLYLNPKAGTVLESLSVFNLQGRELLTCKENLESVNLKNLSSGVYLLALKTNKGTINQRIIKK